MCTTSPSQSEVAVVAGADLWPAGTCNSRKSPVCLTESFQGRLQVGLPAGWFSYASNSLVAIESLLGIQEAFSFPIPGEERLSSQ